MTWAVTIVLFVVGLGLIVKGGDVFVDAASWVAEKTGIPKLIVGATVVSLATTLPEMIVSFLAAGEGKVDMAIGNAVGSVTVNIGLIMGIALICMPTVINRREYLQKALLMLGAALVLTIFGMTGSIGIVPGLLLTAIFVLAMIDNVKMAKSGADNHRQEQELSRQKHSAKESPVYQMSHLSVSEAADGAAAVQESAIILPKSEVIINIAKFVIGAACIVFGSQLLVDNGSALALLLGVPERIVSVTIIAIGTSLPELVTTLSAVAKKQCSLSVGNIIGANIIDLTLILPISALIAGEALPVSPQFARFDIPACLLVGCIAMIPSLITKKFHRAQGVIMVVFYGVYLVLTTMVIG